jgi:hypothetical protein
MSSDPMVEIFIVVFTAYSAGMTAFVAYLKAEVKANRKAMQEAQNKAEENEKNRDIREGELEKSVQEYRELSERVFATFDKFRYMVLSMVRLVRRGDPVPEELLKDIEKIPEVDELRYGHSRKDR